LQVQGITDMDQEASSSRIAKTNAVSHFEQKIRDLRGAIVRIWGHASEGIAFLDACARASEDLDDIHGQRGLSFPVVPVLGNKNAGKTTFCKALLTAPVARDKLPTGLHRGAATTRVTWIGPIRPERLDEEAEAWIPVLKEEMFDPGSPYMLVDVPGFNDAHPSAQAAAKRILPMASVVVLVASWESGLELESLGTYLALGGGATIVPVVVDDAFLVRSPESAQRELARFLDRIRFASPDSEVAKPIHLPRIDSVPPEERDRMRDLFIERIHEALEEALRLPRADPAHLARVRYERLLDELHRGMAPFFDRVGPTHDRLLREENEALRGVVRELLGNRQELAAGIRARLMTRVAQNCPSHWFPFRSLLGLLALTAGAWDRLVLALSGSLPSLALVLFQSGRNLKLLQQRQDSARAALLQRIAIMLKERIADPYRIFVRAVREAASEHSEDIVESVPEYSLEGLSAMEARAQAIVEENVERVALRPAMLAVIGGVSTVVWISLSLGPLWAVYGQFLSASGAVLSGVAVPAWDAFPAPSFSMLFVTVLLVSAPVFFLAMLALALTIRGRIVNSCAENIQKATHEAFVGLMENGLVGSSSDASLHKAVSLIRREIRVAL
jgi:hypothetical protein